MYSFIVLEKVITRNEDEQGASQVTLKCFLRMFMPFRKRKNRLEEISRQARSNDTIQFCAQFSIETHNFRQINEEF